MERKEGRKGWGRRGEWLLATEFSVKRTKTPSAPTPPSPFSRFLPVRCGGGGASGVEQPPSVRPWLWRCRRCCHWQRRRRRRPMLFQTTVVAGRIFGAPPTSSFPATFPLPCSCALYGDTGCVAYSRRKKKLRHTFEAAATTPDLPK